MLKILQISQSIIAGFIAKCYLKLNYHSELVTQPFLMSSNMLHLSAEHQ